MNSAQTFLLSALAICPIVILFGPILRKILTVQEFNLKRDAISTLRDFESTKFGFLIWINLYMISQLMFTFLALPFLIPVPEIIYILGIGSVIFGAVAFVFVSTTYKHMFLIALSFILTFLSMLSLSFYLYFNDISLSAMTFLVGLLMISFLAATMMNRMRMWLVEYFALGSLCVWNLVILYKVV